MGKASFGKAGSAGDPKEVFQYTIGENRMQKTWIKVKKAAGSFYGVAAKGNEWFYLVLLGLFCATQLIFMIGWESQNYHIIWVIYQILFTFVMWGSAVYFFLILISWRNAWRRTGELIVTGLAIFALIGIVSRLFTTDSYTFYMGAFFCLMACGKSYKKIVILILASLTVTLIIGAFGLGVGLTFDAVKPGRVYGGHSLGILYPNNWGFLVFAVLEIAWYLFLRRKKILTLVLFWAVGIFMYRYITCYTIAGLSVLFPLLAAFAEWIQDSMRGEKKSCRFIKWLVVSIPFLFLAAMLFFCWQMDRVHTAFYGTKLHTLAMRFVEGGYALRLNGVTLFGHPFKQFDGSVVEYANEMEMIIDSAFICYLIIRGIIPVVMTLAWISFAHYRCLKESDARLVVISFFMLLLSVMERPGLDAWYNFVLLYPMAALPKEKGSGL